MGLKLEHVSYLYGTDTELLVRALDDVNLEIPDGQFIGLIGHTGSGKSTLVQHLNGLLKPSEGTILFNGENIWAQDYSRKTLRSKVGLVFQYPEHQLFETDVLADVCYGPKNLGSMAWYGLCGMLWRWRGLAFHRPGEKGRRPVCDARLSDYSQLRRQ